MMKHILPVVLMLSSLSAHATEQSPLPWENIPLGTDTFLTFNGSLRERYEWTDQHDLGVSGGGRDDTFMQRLLTGARLDYADSFSAYAQFGSSLATPRNYGRKPTDEDHAYLSQGYVDLKWFCRINSVRPTKVGAGGFSGSQQIKLFCRG